MSTKKMTMDNKNCPETKKCCPSLLRPKYLAQALTALILRLFMANVFWKAGILKLANWDKTLFLFEYEYDTKMIPVSVAAAIATAIEIVCPIMLLFGLGTRIAAGILLAMTLFIHFTYSFIDEDFYWVMLLLVLTSYGAGMLSLDYLVHKCCKHKKLGK